MGVGGRERESDGDIMIHAATSTSPWRDLTNVFSLPKNVPVRNNIIFFSDYEKWEFKVDALPILHWSVVHQIVLSISLHPKLDGIAAGGFINEKKKDRGKGAVAKNKRLSNSKEKKKLYLSLSPGFSSSRGFNRVRQWICQVFLLIRLTKIMSDVWNWAIFKDRNIYESPLRRIPHRNRQKVEIADWWWRQKGREKRGKKEEHRWWTEAKKERTALFLLGQIRELASCLPLFLFPRFKKPKKQEGGGKRTRKLSPRKIYETAEWGKGGNAHPLLFSIFSSPTCP